MPVTTAQKQQLTAAAITMFGVPMGGYAAGLESQLQAANGNVRTVIDQLAAIDYFKSIYSGSPSALATQLAATYGFTSVTGGLGQSVKAFFQSNLEAGASVASLIHAANAFLMGTTDPLYADAKNLLLNKVAVASFYTDAMQGKSQDLGTLAQVLSGVSASHDSVLAAQQKMLLALGSSGIYDTQITPLTSGPDQYTFTSGNESIDAKEGDDTILGGDGADHLIGGTGNDSMNGERGTDWLEGGAGNDKLEAGAYSERNYVKGQWVISYDTSTNTLQGNDGADTLIGGYGSDVLDGGAGNDLLYGDADIFYIDRLSTDESAILFNDTLLGGDGDDTIYGGAGQDWIHAGGGADKVYMPIGGGYANGGDGDDDLTLNSFYTTSDSMIEGGEGNDTIQINASTAIGVSTREYTKIYLFTDNKPPANNMVTIMAGKGNDHVSLTSFGGKATVTLGDGADIVNLGKGMYTVDLTETTDSTDTVNLNNELTNLNDTAAATLLTPVYSTQNNTVSTVKGFSAANDRVDIGPFNLWGGSINGVVNAGSSQSYDNNLTAKYVQTIGSVATAFQWPTGAAISTVNGQPVYNPDYAGKGIFLITGASASAADSATVAQFLNPYGNNATYAAGSSYYFVVDVAGQGAALYLFKDDSNGDNNIVGDELSPIVLLTGVNAADLSYVNFI